MNLQTGAWGEPIALPAAIPWLEGLKRSGLFAKMRLVKPLVLGQLLVAIAKAPSQGADLSLTLGDLLGGLLTTAERRAPFTFPYCFTCLNSGVDALGKIVHPQESKRVCPAFNLVLGPTPVWARAVHSHVGSEKKF